MQWFNYNINTNNNARVTTAIQACRWSEDHPPKFNVSIRMGKKRDWSDFECGGFWLLMPNRLRECFTKCWSVGVFTTVTSQMSPWFPENGPKTGTHPVSNRCVDENGLVTSGLRGLCRTHKCNLEAVLLKSKGTLLCILYLQGVDNKAARECVLYRRK